MTETDPHRWPACPWPGWALLYARLIRDLRAMDPGLVVEDFDDGANLSIGFVTPSTDDPDAVFDRIDRAERLAEATCVVCGVQGSGWPPLCAEHAG